MSARPRYTSAPAAARHSNNELLRSVINFYNGHNFGRGVWEKTVRVFARAHSAPRVRIGPRSDSRFFDTPEVFTAISADENVSTSCQQDHDVSLFPRELRSPTTAILKTGREGSHWRIPRSVVEITPVKYSWANLCRPNRMD